MSIETMKLANYIILARPVIIVALLMFGLLLGYFNEDGLYMIICAIVAILYGREQELFAQSQLKQKDREFKK